MSFVKHDDPIYPILYIQLIFSDPRSAGFQFSVVRDHFSLLLALQESQGDTVVPYLIQIIDLLSVKDRGQLSLWILIHMTRTLNTIKTYLSTLVEMESIRWSHGKPIKEVV